MERLPKISIIVPVYNVKEYVEQCITSIINQTQQDIEIIIINDGSSDGSGKICDEIAKKDSRISVFHKSNEGLSAARNVGLDFAKAEYVMFVDSDDWVEPDCCATSYKVAKETDAEIVVFQRTWHSGNNIECQPPFPKEGIVSKKEILTSLWSLVGVISWNKLYKRELFNGIRFPVGRLCEDNAVTHRVIHKAKSVYLLNKSLYHHRTNRQGSIMVENSEKKVSDEAYLNMCRISDLREWGYISRNEESKQALMYLIIMGRAAELSALCKEIIEGNGIIGDKVSLKLRVMYKLYDISPRIFDLISTLTGKRLKQRNSGA